MSGPFDLPVSGSFATATGGHGPETASSPKPSPAHHRWAPTDVPRLLDGIVVPALSAVAYEGRPVYTPASNVKTVSSTARAVGFYSTAGQWVPVWVGDDPDVRDAALTALLDDLARYTYRR